jgi:small nuclear ribonucleoprotein (snRNP)-like protein
MKNEMEQLLNQKVVLDTSSNWVYIGTLENVTQNCAILTDVDVHDSKDTSTSKELYVLESKSTGVKSNRQQVYVNLSYVVSFSPLDNVKTF